MREFLKWALGIHILNESPVQSVVCKAEAKKAKSTTKIQDQKCFISVKVS